MQAPHSGAPAATITKLPENFPKRTIGAGEARKEDPTAIRLRRAWRSLASSLVVAARAAEKTAKAAAAAEVAAQNQVAGAAAAKFDRKGVEDALFTTLRARTELRRVATLAEAKLRGNARETESLELCQRSQPSIGKKRKRGEE